MSPQKEKMLKIATFNAHGARGKMDEITKLASKVQVLGVCETWARAADSALQSQFSESVSVLTNHGGWRGQGGVSLIINPLLHYTVVKKYAQAEYQLIIVKIGDTYFAAVYMKPNSLKSCFTACMEIISENTSGNVVLMGDLNARHTRWDRVCNSQGRWLQIWAAKYGWKINAPSEPTFSAHSGHSTVDLVLTKNISAEGTSVFHGSWDGCSDHFAVQATVIISGDALQMSNKIPYSQRSNPKYIRIASTLYKEKLPPLARSIEDCRDKNILEDLYQRFKNIILDPWSEARKPRKRRFKYFWNRHLDQMKKQRSKLYRLATKSRAPNDWDKYHEKDREIRKTVQNRKRESLEKSADFIQKRGMSDGLKIVKSILKGKSGAVMQSENSSLNPKKFTEHIAGIGNGKHTPDIIPFELPRHFFNRVCRAIENSRPRKATGSDEIFYESLQVNPKLCAEVLCNFWKKCAELKYRLNDWNSVLLTPIHKKGDKSDPANYRPIALISHARQVIARAVATEIRSQYRNHWTQLGFQEHTGTETAIIRHVSNSAEGLKFSAVLDLKSAYNIVPRDKLMETVRKKLPERTAAMIALLLQPENISCKGDTGKSTAWVSSGVPQGCAASPTIFNLYMDTLPEKIDAAPDLNIQNCQISLFADDVKIQAKNQEALKASIKICSEWADDFGMQWSTKKCHILEPTHINDPGKYILSGKELMPCKQATYLGVTLGSENILPTKNLARVENAVKRLNMLRACGLNRQTLSSAKLINICKAFVFPVAQYAVHLLPDPCRDASSIGHKLEELDYKVVEYAMGCVSKNSVDVSTERPRIKGRLPRMLKLSKIPDWSQKISLALTSLDDRLRKRSDFFPSNMEIRNDIQKYSRAREVLKSPGKMSKMDLVQGWKKLCQGKVRKIPTPKTGLSPILRVRDRKIRESGIKWYFGSFPGRSEPLRTVLGNSKFNEINCRLNVWMKKEEMPKNRLESICEDISTIIQAMENSNVS